MMDKKIKDKKIVIVGAGVSGIAAAKLCLKEGAKKVRLVDKNEKLSKNEEILKLKDVGVEVRFGEHKKEDFEDAELVVLSPGVKKEKIVSMVPKGALIISEIELGFWFLDEPIIGVTGTNGKTTTASLIAHVLKKRFKVFLGGNIGTPLCSYLLSDKKADILVLELSSFQLENIHHFKPHVSLFLNFSSNHLDFHKDEEEYFMAKLKIFINQDHNDYAILEKPLLEKVLKRIKLPSKIITFDGKRKFNSSLLGEHNQKNMEAAYLACSIFGISEDEFNKSLKGFRPHPHRLDVFLKKDGVLFVDDSKATTLAATEAAIKSFDNKIILLAGGRFKGGDPFKLNDILSKKVKKLILFGECREIFYEAWKNVVDTIKVFSLKDAVDVAVKEAKPGDVVLLSPGTSSFDEFRDYKERGLFFQKRVKEILNVIDNEGFEKEI